MIPISIPVKRHLNSQPIYHLIYLTRHAEGLWSFLDSLAMARPDWLAAMPKDDDAAEQDLFSIAGIEIDSPSDLMRKQAQKEQLETIPILKKNILSVAESRGQFKLVDNIAATFKGVTAIAAEKNVRAAINELIGERKILLVDKDKNAKIQRNLYSLTD